MSWLVNLTYVVCFFFPVWLWPLYGFYLNRFSALSIWSDGCNWYQTGVFSFLSHSFIKETIVFAPYKFSYTELWVTKKCRWSYGQTWVTCFGRRLTRDELNISLDKDVLSCNNFGSYHIHGQTGRLKDQCGMKWRLINSCGLSIHWVLLSLQTLFTTAYKW